MSYIRKNTLKLESIILFDVGANIGNRTRIFLKLGGEVLAIEPQENCVDILQALYRKDKDIKIIQKVFFGHG